MSELRLKDVRPESILGMGELRKIERWVDRGNPRGRAVWEMDGGCRMIP